MHDTETMQYPYYATASKDLHVGCVGLMSFQCLLAVPQDETLNDEFSMPQTGVGTGDLSSNMFQHLYTGTHHS